MTIPHSQTAAAVYAAAEARRRESKVTSKIRDGSLTVATVLLDDDGDLVAVGRMSLGLLLRYQPGIGLATARTICRTARIDRWQIVRDLSPERRRAVADALAPYDSTTYRGRGPARRAS